MSACVCELKWEFYHSRLKITTDVLLGSVSFDAMCAGTATMVSILCHDLF